MKDTVVCAGILVLLNVCEPVNCQLLSGRYPLMDPEAIAASTTRRDKSHQRKKHKLTHTRVLQEGLSSYGRSDG